MRYLIFLLVTAVAGTARSDTNGDMIIAVDAASAEIHPLAGDVRLILLPSLEYALSIEPRCAANMQAESISVSVADTRETRFVTSPDERSVVDIRMTIPQRQLGPVAVDRFCRLDHLGSATDRALHVKGVVTAQLSLRCVGETARSIVYAAQPLDVNLQCLATANQEYAEPEQDQGSSPSLVPR